MILFDILIWMAVAKIAVLLLEDTAYAVRGKQSPRQRERAQHRAAEAAGQPRPRPSSGPGRARAAIGDYLAGVIEDASAGARARKRRAQARKRGRQAVDGVFVDLDTDEDGFYADCDLCGWSSRRYRIEANALAAGREHTRTEHPDEYHADPTPEPQDGGDTAEQGAGAQPDPDVIDMATRLACNRCSRGVIGDDGLCRQCGQPFDRGTPAPGAGGPAEGRPKLRVIPGGQPETQASPSGTPAPQPSAPPEPEQGQVPRDGASGEPDRSEPDGDSETGAGNSAGTTDNKENNTVNLEAQGPDEIRAAFTEAKTTTDEKGEEITALAGVLVEAAERFEQLEMAGSTVELLREASESLKAAAGQLEQGGEHLESALTDFNAKDGHVADTAADVGNLAGRDVLVGS